jgi:DNA-binding HxlR family transcriptional regulator
MGCPIDTLLDLIGDRWTLRLLHELIAGPHRTQALLGNLTGISSRTLAAKLKHLESLGLINRKVFAEVPPRVEYELTERGRMLERVFPVLRTTAEQVFGSKRTSKTASPCPSCEAVEQKAIKPLPVRVERQITPAPGHQSRQRPEDVTLL